MLVAAGHRGLVFGELEPSTDGAIMGTAAFSYTVKLVRPITQAEAERRREALKTIAGYHNPAAPQDGVQAAARLARETLESTGLLYQEDADPPIVGA